MNGCARAFKGLLVICVYPCGMAKVLQRYMVLAGLSNVHVEGRGMGVVYMVPGPWAEP